MKYAAVVFRNIATSSYFVKFFAAADALLSGGVPLSEIVLLPYDEPGEIMRALKRLSEECDGVFIICDRRLLPAAREAISVLTGRAFREGTLLETEARLFAVLEAGEKGKTAALSEVVPAVNRRRRRAFRSVVIRTVYAPPSKVTAAVAHAQDEADGRLFVHTSEEFGVGRIEVIYDQNTPKVVADEVVRIIASELQAYVYAMEDVSIAQRLFEALDLHRLKLSTAESFTGGGVGQAIVSIPGASRVFFEGLNTYDGLSKSRRLGVKEFTLRQKGAVSSETAFEMAEGLLKSGTCDVAIATTGIAGPDSDGSGTPPGKCFLAIGYQNRVRVFEYDLSGDRETVIKTAINLALFLAYMEVH